MRSIVWTNRVVKGKVLKPVKEDRNILHIVKRRRLTGLVTSCLLKHFTEGEIEGG